MTTTIPSTRSPDHRVAATVASIGVAHPPSATQEELWDGFFAAHYAGVAPGLAKRIFTNSGVRRRHGVVNPLVEDPSGWSTAERMRRYLVEALPLGKDALASALARAGVAATDVGMLVVCSCTGYATPGLDILLARDLAMATDLRRVLIGHMGCYAALPGLGVAADFVAQHERPAVLLCVELPSLHVQPSERDVQQVVAHALFSDAAAAVVLVPNGSGPRVVRVVARTDPTTADHMTWHITDLGFRMGLSPEVPDALARQVEPAVGDLLGPSGLDTTEVSAWAVHPGGPRILEVVAQRLALPGDALASSTKVLAEHGNCSSATVLLVLDDLLRRSGGLRGPGVAMAFGPGLTLYAALLA
ncbi:MAG: type III polyketide synthase [Micromonosporaceae bacterium]|nr:type III polyketide synthase [Micromonosporaceae bacterium]